jgi:uncharacterized protein YceK
LSISSARTPSAKSGCDTVRTANAYSLVISAAKLGLPYAWSSNRSDTLQASGLFTRKAAASFSAQLDPSASSAARMSSSRSGENSLLMRATFSSIRVSGGVTLAWPKMPSALSGCSTIRAFTSSSEAAGM